MTNTALSDLDDLLNKGVQPKVAAERSTTGGPQVLHARPTAEFTFDALVLQTTYRQCVCGERWTGIDLFEHHTAPARCAGKPTVISKLVPIYRASIPTNLPIQEVTKILPLAVCPKCVATHPYTGTQLQPLDEQRWRETVRRKAVESSAAPAAAGRESKVPSVPTLEALDKFLGL